MAPKWRLCFVLEAMMRKLMLVLCAFTPLAIHAGVAAFAEDLAAAVKERRALMKKTVAPAAKLGGQMLKGVVPFDAAKASRAMSDINGVPDKYVTLFPEGTEAGAVTDSEALPAIWEEFDEFKALATKLKERSAEAASAAGQSEEAFATAFRDMTSVCKECHESFREKTD